MNLKGTTAQYQINGVNILDNVITTSTLANYALINSPTFTGIPKAPTAVPGTNSTQLATTAYVQSAISGVGGFNPNTAYTWGSNYQLFGNNQVICIGQSTLPTIPPISPATTSSAQGLQICNNQYSSSETDLINYGNGFNFSSVNATNNQVLGTMYRSGNACIFNLPTAGSQFQINGTSIARQLTPTTQNLPIPPGTYTYQTANGIYYTQVTTNKVVVSSTINGVTTLSVSFNGNLVENSISFTNTYYAQNGGGTVTTPQYAVLGAFGPATPAPTMPFTFQMTIYQQNGTAVPCFLTYVVGADSIGTWILSIAQYGLIPNFTFTQSQVYYVPSFTITYS
jgi:hypothetical protein